MRSLAGLGAKVGARLLVLGDYWRADCDERTAIGWLVHRAKDRAEDAAARELAERFAGLAEALAEIPDGSERLVVPVPSMPAPADATGQVPLAGMLARSLAAAGAGEYRRDLLAKDRRRPRACATSIRSGGLRPRPRPATGLLGRRPVAMWWWSMT